MTTNQRAELFAAIRAEGDAITAAKARQLVAIAVACDSYSGLDTHEGERTARVLHGEQLVFPGANDTPGVTEFFHLELALSLGCSPETAQVWTADVLNLRHRHPILWDATIAGDIPVWVTRDISRAALHLSFTQAREFDSLWALRHVSLTPRRAIKTIEAQVALIRQRSRTPSREETPPGPAPPAAPSRGHQPLRRRADHLNGTLGRLADVLKAGGSTASRHCHRDASVAFLDRRPETTVYDGFAVPDTGRGGVWAESSQPLGQRGARL